MIINKKNALKLWNETYGENAYIVKDFHGKYMCKEAYADRNFQIVINGETIECGWNIHHMKPKSLGGKNEKDNLICTNITTNEKAGNKTTYWIDDSLYQIKLNDEKQCEIWQLK